MEVVSNVIEQISTILVQAFVPIAVGFVIVFLKRQVAILQNKLSTEQWNLIVMVVDTAVQVAEQSGLAGFIANEGAKKKEYAIDFAMQTLAKYGLVIDVNMLADAIEAAVYSNFKWGRPELPLPEES